MEVLSKQIEDTYFEQSPEQRNFLHTVAKVFKWDVIACISLSWFGTACGMIDPMIMRWLSEYITSDDDDVSRGLWLLFLLFGS